jgi:hypothetical protein
MIVTAVLLRSLAGGGVELVTQLVEALRLIVGPILAAAERDLYTRLDQGTGVDRSQLPMALRADRGRGCLAGLPAIVAGAVEVQRATHHRHRIGRRLLRHQPIADV